MNCKIILADGTELDNLTFDNNVYVSPTEVTAAMLNDEALELVKVIPTDGEETELKYAKTDIVYHEADGWHFVLVGASADEIKIREQQARIRFLEDCLMEISEEVWK